MKAHGDAIVGGKKNCKTAMGQILLLAIFVRTRIDTNITAPCTQSVVTSSSKVSGREQSVPR
jgi:hypothetical protein